MVAMALGVTRFFSGRIDKRGAAFIGNYLLRKGKWCNALFHLMAEVANGRPENEVTEARAKEVLDKYKTCLFAVLSTSA
jgi:hypothetical protein